MWLRARILVVIIIPLLAAGRVDAQQGVRGSAGSGGTEQAAWLRYIEAQRLAAEGFEREDSRLLDRAIGAFRETIRLDPSAAAPRIDLGNLYLFALTEPELAEKEAWEAIRLAPENPEGHLILARLAYLNLRRQEQLGNKDSRPDRSGRVLTAYRRVAELDPRHAEAWLILQGIYEAEQRFDDQIIALERFLASPPIAEENIFVRQMINPPFTTDRALFKLSLLYLLRGRDDEALAAARRAYESDPESDDYVENLFEVIGHVSSRDEEVGILARLVGSAASPRVRLRYADALVRAGREEEALRSLSEVEAEPATRARLTATAQRRLNRREAAVVTLRSALAAAGAEDRPGLQFELAETIAETGADAEALRQYGLLFDQLERRGAAAAVEPLFGQTAERLARLLRRSGNQAGFQALLTRIRRLVDEHSPLPDLLAIEALSDEGRPAEALTLVRAAARRNRDDQTWVATEAELLAEIGQFEEALHLIEGRLTGRPDSVAEDCDLHLQLSFIHLRQALRQGGEKPTVATSVAASLANPPAGQSANPLANPLAGALTEVRRVLELAGTNGYLREPRIGARLQLASILHRQGAYEESERLLREILREDPVNPTALNNLGYFLVERGVRLDEARQLIERAVAIEPLNASFLDSLGWALFRLGDLKGARSRLERALFLARRSATTNEHLGELLMALGRRLEARRHWQRALELADEEGQRERLRGRLRESAPRRQ